MELVAPGNPEDDVKLAREIADSVQWVTQMGADRSRRLEVRDPERACQIIAMLCRGIPHRTIIAETGVNVKALNRLSRDHSEVVQRTKTHRAIQATRLQLKAADALEKKLEDVLEDDEVRAKTSVKDLAMGYGIATDKQRVIHGEGTVVTHEHKVTLEDARAAIEEAKKEVSQEVIDV
tara:strand:- start:232 stop:765 length:534 start_codon:yes stop_codon:yes gene_type:complete